MFNRPGNPNSSYAFNPDEPTIRLSRPDDMNRLVSMDLKCYQYPHLMDWWKAFLDPKDKERSSNATVMEVNGSLCGYCAWDINKSEDPEVITLEIRRLGIVPTHRRRGYSRKLLYRANSAAKAAKATCMTVFVPELLCNPGDPDDLSEFLNKSGFLPTGVLQRNYLRMYGTMYDGIEWVRVVK